jgi:hypothetical protein
METTTTTTTSKLSAVSDFMLNTIQDGSKHVNNHKIFILNNDMSYENFMSLLKKYNTVHNKIWTSENLRGFLSENPVQIKKDGSQYLIYKLDKDYNKNINSFRYDLSTNDWVEEVKKEDQIFLKGSNFISRGEMQMELS